MHSQSCGRVGRGGGRVGRRACRGSAMVEFLAVLPMLLFIFLAIVQFGLVLHAYLSIAHASNVGARVAAVRKPEETVIAAVLASVGPAVNLGEADVAVGEATEIAGTDDLGVPVSVTYDFPLTLPIVRELFPDGAITIRSVSTLRME